ncbi:MAG: hypothetical protein JW739_05750 [Opitutales bacterium]|nr:hypothetical protein [Opitutales bacterium]
MQNSSTNVEIKQSPYKKRIKYPGIGFKARHMGINPNTLYKYLDGIWTKPSNFEPRYEAACKALEEFENNNRK